MMYNPKGQPEGTGTHFVCVTQMVIGENQAVSISWWCPFRTCRTVAGEGDGGLPSRVHTNLHLG